MPSAFPMIRRTRHRNLIPVRVAFLVPVLVAAFVFHVSGSTLVVMRIARSVLVALLLLGVARIKATPTAQAAD